MEEAVFKLVLLGDMGTGKSALVMRFVRGEFHEHSESTIGAAFLSKSCEVDRAPTRIEIWDTAGQERYRSLAPMYYRGSQAAIIVFDLTARETFEGAKRWARDLARTSEPGVVIALAGNKADLAGAGRAVDAAEAEAWARDNGMLYVETSARTGERVGELFMEVARRVPRNVEAARPAGVVMGRLAEGKGDAKGREAAKGGCCG